MTDNTTLNAGSGGDTIATDDLAGVKYQRVKVNFGADGSATDVAAGSPLPVDTELTTVDADTGAGTDTRASIVLVRAESGGGVLVGSANPLPVSVGTVTVSDGDKLVDNSAFTDGTSKVDPAGFIFDEVVGTALTENDVAAARIDSKRAIVNVLEDATVRGRRAKVAATGEVSVSIDNQNATVTVGGTVTANAGTGTFTTSDSQTIADNNAFTDGTSKVFASGYIFDEVAGTALTENDVAAARVNSNRAQVLVIEDDTTRGRRATVTASNALKVDGSAVTQPVSGTITANAGTGTLNTSDQNLITDNNAFTDGTSKLFMAGYILDDTAGTALTENDAAAPRISTNRATVGVIEDGTTRARYATVTASNALKVDGSASTQPVSGTVSVNALPTGSSLIGDVGIKPRTSGGLTIFHLVSAASTNATNIKASAGQVFGWYISNRNSSSFMKVAFHNTAGTPTAGSGVVSTVDIPPLSAANVFDEIGIAFGTGIAITTVSGAADTDATAVAANDLNINIFYS